MKTIVQDAFGSPDVRELRDLDKPEIGEHDGLLRVHSAALDQGV